MSENKECCGALRFPDHKALRRNVLEHSDPELDECARERIAGDSVLTV